MPRITLLTFVLLFIQLAYGQSAKEQLKLVNAVTLQNTNFYEEISFQDKFGYFIIPVKIGNNTYEYIFDTGGYNTLTSEIMHQNDLTELMNIEVGSANQLKSKVVITKIPTLEIGDLVFENIGAFNFNFESSPQIQCYTNGGLLGKSIIKNAVWQINTEAQKIIITDDIRKLHNLKNATKLKVKLDKVYNPFVKATLNGKTYTFLLDFGFGGFVSLTEKDGKSLDSKNIIEITGEGTVSANGIVDESTFIKPIDVFEIGDFKLSNQNAYYAAFNNYNLLGSEIAKHFIVTLNFKDSELFLTPISKKNKASHNPRHSFGFSLNRNENTIYVSSIFKGGNAEKAGLKLNDEILSINNKKFTDKTYCDFYEYIKDIMLNTETTQLEVKENGVTKSLTISKRTLFN